MKFVDSHAHVYLDQFDEDRESMMQRTLEEDVNQIIMPNIDHSTIDSMMEMEEKYPLNCYSTMGLHPCSVTKNFEKELYIVEDWLKNRKFKAIGETGIDLYWDKTFIEQQKEALIIQINWAKELKIPIILHCRDSFVETIEIIEEYNSEDLHGVFHCFTGSKEDAERVVKLDNFYLGIGGVATFKNGGLDKVLPGVSMDKIILETDSPYLAPTPYRGKRNESSYIPIIAKRVAEIKDLELEEVASKTTTSSSELFDI